MSADAAAPGEDPHLARLDRLAAAAWPALDTRRHGAWLLRAARGVTKRANSVLPIGDVPDLAAAVSAAEEFAGGHGIPPLFQLSPASRPAGLADHLAARGYRPADRTLVLTGDVAEALARLGAGPAVASSEEPDGAWLDAWWSVDGRGGAAELAVARRILRGAPSLYAQVPGPEGEALATGRLALGDADGERWCGLFALATRPAARRRGHAATVVRSLLTAARARGIERLWIQVLADNAPALAFYRSLGCAPASEYAYWSRG